MSFRSRILLGSVLLVWIPILALAWIIRDGMAARLTEEHTRRVETLLGVLGAQLERETGRVQDRLADLEAGIAADNRFRLIAVEGMEAERQYVLDYAERAMRLLGLSMLQIQDAEGRILSSGHFRNDYGRLEPALPSLLASSPDGYALMQARAPGGDFLALACTRPFRLGDRSFHLVGGLAVGRDFLASVAPDSTLTVSLVHPGGAVSSEERVAAHLREVSAREGWSPERSFPPRRYLTRATAVPFVTADGLGEATLVASYSLASRTRLLRGLDLWLGGVLLVVVAGTLVLSLWISARLSRPLVELADRTTRVDLDRLETVFPAARRDEIGDLARFLNSMMRRLRASVLNLRDAERRATLGEMARQVNHDVKNGLLPIRNVFRHLREVVREDPSRLADVFAQREKVLDSSIGYLEGLAENYARLYTENPREPCDLNAIVRTVASARTGIPGIRHEVRADASRPRVLADPISVRRIVDNLVTNAEDSLAAGGGTVTLITETGTDDDGHPAVRLAVEDTGPGIPEEDRGRIFDDFFSTKAGGAGLGLSIVRRMVADSSGSIRLESAVGRGARFVVEWPVAEAGARSPGRAQGEAP